MFGQVLTLSILRLASAQLAEVFTVADKDAAVDFLSALQVEDGSFGDALDNYYAARSLQALGAEVHNVAQLCETSAAAALDEDVEILAAAVATLKTLHCKELGTAGKHDRIKSALAAALASDELKDVYFGLLGVASLDLAGSLPNDAIGRAVQTIAGQWDNAVDESVINAGFGFAGAAIAIGSGSAEGELWVAAEALLSRAEAIVQMAEDMGDGVKLLEFVDEEADVTDSVANLRVTSIVLAGLSSLAAAVDIKLTIPASTMAKLAEYVLQFKTPGTAEEAFYFVTAISVFTRTELANPVAVKFAHMPALSMGATGGAGSLRVVVSDILGEDVGETVVELTRATFMEGTDEETAAVEAPVALIAGGGGAYAVAFAMLAGVAAAGHGPYRADLSIRLAAARFGTEPQPASALIKVATTAQATAFRMMHITGDGAKRAEFSLDFPGSVGEVVAVVIADSLTLEFKVRSKDDASYLQPHQATARLSRAGDPREAIFVAVPSSEDPELMSVSVAMAASIGSIFDQQNGEYALQVIVGDFFIQNTVAWDVATLAFSGGADDAGAVPTDRPTIEHQFRKPESRPPEIVSYVFVAAVLAPAAGLLWGFGRIGANVAGFPNGIAAVFAVTFHASVFGVVYLLLGFWLVTPLLATLGRVAGTSAVVVFTGHRSLRASALQAATVTVEKSKGD